MVKSRLNDISITSLKKIHLDDGDVLHALKKSEKDFNEFGEAYFSFIKSGKIKAWKLHKTMNMNVIVPIGSIKFVFYCPSKNYFRKEVIGSENYSRLFIPNNIWFGFQGVSNKTNLLLNISDIVYNDNEVKKCDINEIPYDW